MTVEDDRLDGLAAEVAGALDGTDLRLAVAESLTGGQLSAVLARARDASTWYRGGIVAYARGVKHDVLDVPPGPDVCDATCERALGLLLEVLDVPDPAS